MHYHVNLEALQCGQNAEDLRRANCGNVISVCAFSEFSSHP